MDFEELKNYLPTLTLSQLKGICNIPRQWGVYKSSPSISGYSKYRNKKDLIAHILKHFKRYTLKHYGDNECPNYFGYVQKEIEFYYHVGIIKMETKKIKYLGEE